MSSLPALFMSWLAAVPTSFGAGWLLSQGKPASVALIFLLSLGISMDIANRAGLEKGMFYGLAGLMAAILTVVSYTPWMVALKKDPKSAGAKALPISGLLFAVVTLAFSVGFGFMKQKEGGLQGGLITLMYVFVSGSMGYSGAQAKTNPSAKGNTIYMLGLLVLLTMFDVSGALRAKNAALQGNSQKIENLKAHGEEVVINENTGAIGTVGKANLAAAKKKLEAA